MAKVLIVEDSESQAAIISSIVESAGHEAILCPDLKRGISQTVMSVEPDIVLLDLVLLDEDGKPLQDGFQMCREIKRVSNNQIGVIVVSAKGDEESAQWAIMQGADAFLQKPFVVEELIEVMNEVLQVK
ncbi:MAG: response regulator transcription factor [Deltaproteobacteria bacterium]|nr:response regulator transcription factor [Deltaproteobacteria bacterium]